MPIWTIGYRENGDQQIGGPWRDRQDAEDATAHLSRVRFVTLETGNRREAVSQLRSVAKNQSHRSESNEPDLPPKRGIVSRIMHRETREEEAIE